MKKRLFVSFSGGSTSAYMAKRLKDEYSATYELLFGFANTGEENEETLVFADRCDREWGLNLVWLEAVVHGPHVGTTHRIVSYATASRKGEPYEEVIKKYGIPNKVWPHCTRELKLRPMRSYLNSIGWTPDTHLSAVGIRKDEPRRIRKDAEKEGIIYPLANVFPTDKPTIMAWWEEQAFRLELADYRGNCKWCWKKNIRKLVRVAQETPEAFEFPARMEHEHGLAGINKDGKNRVFFRGNTSVQQIMRLATLGSVPANFNQPDEDAGCSESCEVFA